jgi:hypothetical protein
LTGFHSDAALEFEQPHKRVAVIGAQADALPTLLGWLERVFPVRFELGGTGDARAADGVLVLDPERLDEAPEHLPRLVLAAAERRAPSSAVALADDGRLARPLRKRKIAEHARVGELTLTPHSDRDVLARVEERAVWWQSGDGGLQCSLYPLAELGEAQTLRDHLCPGSFMGLLPLLHFLRQLLAEEGWKLPAPRAAFVIDDPNLHWPSYGFLKYPQLAEHASRHGYHLAFATVPLDGWRVNARAVATIREHPAALSLLIHGNDHVARELAGLNSDRQAEAAMAQALRRIATLERASGLSVARVMAPPHGVCSEAALRAMFRLGFEAACISRPYPWRDGLPAPTPLAGWHPAELVAGGIPVAPRQALTASREELVFRALLGQPLILHGHHGDFADGLDLLEQAAADINDLGKVRWGSLDGVAGGAYATRGVDGVLLVQMYGRRVSVDIPQGIDTLFVLAQEPLGGAGWHEVRYSGGGGQMIFKGGTGLTGPLSIGAAGKLDLELVADRPLDPLQVAAPRRKAWPLARRLLVEGRDRLQPLL